MASEEESKTESHAGRWALWIVAALVIYVLSPGPVMVAMVKMQGSKVMSPVLGVVYAPLVLVLEKSPPLQRSMEFYMGWWFKVCGVSF